MIVDGTNLPTEAVAAHPRLRHIIFLGTGARSYMDPDALAATVRAKVIVDGRNCLDSTRWTAAGWKYHALGRRVG